VPAIVIARKALRLPRIAVPFNVAAAALRQYSGGTYLYEEPACQAPR